MRTSAILAAAALISAPAAAITVDFNDMANDNFFFSPGNVYVSQGYRFSNDGQGQGPVALFGWGRLNNAIVYNADANPQTGTTLAHGYNNTITTVTRVDGAAFTLSSLFLADPFNTGSLAPGMPVNFTFTTASGTTSETRFLDALRGLQAEVFNRSGLLSFTIGPRQYDPPNAFPVAGLVQIDNVGLTLDAAAPGVPEPASWAMLIAGFGLTGAALRRRRAALIV